jgi:outer membrane protein OmpA-like peptidoglycan-associated protein/tetratricopeptide (TPR) repeat protein
MQRLVTIVNIVLVAVLLMGCGAESAMKKGDKFYALGEYYDAANQYKKAYAQTPSKERELRGQRAMKMAECYRRINNTQRAIASYNNVVRYKQQDSLTPFFLGQMLMKNGDYKNAEKSFQAAVDSLLLTDSPYLQLAKEGLKAAKQAPELKRKDSRYTVKREDLFNSRRADFSPMLTGDDNEQLYFTSTRNQAQGDELSGITGTKPSDIFFVQKDDKGKWGKPQTIDSELNSAFDEGACCFSPDGRTMYLTQCKTDANYPRYATIVQSQRSDASWSKPTEVVVSKDTLSAFAHPAVSPDGLWLYFVSNMPGGMGGYDIWRAELLKQGVGPVENLGAPINTPGDELFPTFRPNGDLYFSSNGHPGLGGLDIFIAAPTNLPQPEGASPWVLEHPGFPLNSQGDDFGMTFEGLHNRGYFSSNRGDARGWDHIYSFEKSEMLLTVKGWVYEMDGYELPAGQVYMVGNDGTNLKLNVKGDGSFTQEIQTGVDYVFLGTCRGYLNHKEELRVDTATVSNEYVLQFPLANISAPVLIENIFYDFDKATLRPESATALDQLVKLLNDNPHVTIELSAHTDYKGSDQYNERLSQRRAESVVNYLIEHGIAADRLTPKGYGEGKPKTIKRKVAEKYPFLKEGDVLTEAFVTALKDEEQQEQCNQLNRRTEFIVLRTTYGMFDEEGKLKNPPQPKATTDEPEKTGSDDWF